jgi:CubicO group peptidase (beta-lactamase class C family)
MTATLAGILVERGLIEWDTPARDVLSIEQAHPDVTLTTLLTHAAGVRPLEEDEEIAELDLQPGSPTEQRLAASRILLADAPAFAPGTAHRYSNGGYAIAATMLELVADTPWETLMTTEIFDPLGMDAGHGWPAQPWGHREENGRLRPQDPDGPYRLGPETAPAGDVNASIRSYGEFVQMHLRGLRRTDGLVSAGMFRHLHTANEASPTAGAYNGSKALPRARTPAAPTRSTPSSFSRPNVTSRSRLSRTQRAGGPSGRRSS